MSSRLVRSARTTLHPLHATSLRVGPTAGAILAGLVFFCVPRVSLAALQECRIQDATDEGGALVMENGFLKVTIEPTSGGRLARVEYKPGQVDLTCFGPYRGSRPGGLFGDRLTTQNYPGDYLETSAEVVILDNTPERVRVRLRTRGRSGAASNLTIEKVLELTHDCSSLDVRAAMRFDTGTTDPRDTIQTGLWWQHVLRIGEPGSQAGRPNTYFVPLSSGILSIPFVPGARNTFTNGNGFLRNPARGWMGALAPGEGAAKERVGAAFTLEYSPLLDYYICMLPSLDQYPTLEWYYQPRTLRDGEQFETRVRLIPCRGLSEISGADGGIVGELLMKEAVPPGGGTIPIHIGLVSDRTRPVRIDVRVRRADAPLTDANPAPVQGKTLTLGMDEPAHMRMDVPRPDAEGTYAVEVRVRDADGKTRVTFEKPLTVGAGSGDYVLQPTEPRVIEESTVTRRPNLSGPATPHTDWAAPLRRGPIRALVFSEVGLARQVVELGQRLALDCDDVLLRSRRLIEKNTAHLWGQRDSAACRHYGVEEHESETERLRRLITHNTYDVMIVPPNGLRLGNVPEDIRKLVLQRVRDGMGLVCLGPGPHAPGTEWLDDVLPLRVAPGPAIRANRSFIDGARERESGLIHTGNPALYVSRGIAEHIPFAVLPPTILYADERLVQAENTPLLLYDGHPMLVTAEEGKGRVAVLNAAMHNLEINTYYTDHEAVMRAETYLGVPWQEYAYLLLAQTTRWAAKREAGLALAAVDVERADAAGIELGIGITNRTAIAADLRSEITVRDRFYSAVTGPSEHTIGPLAAGTGTQVVFRLEHALPAGSYTAELRLLDAVSNVTDSGSVPVRVPATARIADVTPAERLQRCASSVDAHITVEADQEMAARLEWRLRDTYNRTIGAGEMTADLVAGRNLLPLDIEMPATGSRVVDLDLFLRSRQGPLHRHISHLFVHQPRRVDDIMFEVYVLAGGHSSMRPFPFMRRLGVDAGGCFYGATPWNTAFLAARHNLVPLFGPSILGDFRFFGVAGALRAGPPASWPDIVPDDLANRRVWPGIRRPGTPSYGTCAHDAECLETREAVLRKRAPVIALYSSLDCYVADECTFQRDTYVRGEQCIDDLCFCRHCLAAFRTYLQADYGTLDALNAGWETDYTAWEQVMPLPGRQARKETNWSRWLDFRLFTAKSYCGAVTAVQDRLRRADAGARVSGNIHWESPWTAYMAYYLHGPGANASSEVYPRTFEQVRSYSPAPAFRRIHVGYATYRNHLRSKTDHYAWRNLGYGGGRTDFYNGIEGLVGGVLEPTYKVAVMGEWLRDLDAGMRRTGIGKAILTSIPDPPLIGVMESYPSQFAWYLEPDQFDAEGYYRRPDWTMSREFKQRWEALGALSEDLGLPWRLVNEEECAQSVPAGLRVIFLPRATCLARRTVDALERFVRAGGTVIADLRLGERDRHGRPHAAGGPDWLGDLFGIQRHGGTHDVEPVELTVEPSEAVPVRYTLAVSGCEPTLEAAGARPHGLHPGGAPHTLIRPVGKGVFVYLNYTLDSYLRTRSAGTRSLLGDLLSSREVKLDYGLFEPGGGPRAINVLCLRRRRGPIDYYFILHNPHGPRTEQVELVLPDAAHLYDVGAHAYLGHCRRVSVEPSTTRGRLIAAVPYRLNGLSLTVAGLVPQGHELQPQLTFATSSDSPGDHVVRIEVTRPDGTACAYWSGNVLAERGHVAPAWRTALDEEAGTWRVRVLDVLSGHTAEASFVVRSEPSSERSD